MPNDPASPASRACAGISTDLTIHQKGARQCIVGKPCRFEIEITNRSDTSYSGQVKLGNFASTSPDHPLQAKVQSPLLACKHQPSDRSLFECVARLDLKAGESQTFRLEISHDLVLPPGFRVNVLGCSTLSSQDFDAATLVPRPLVDALSGLRHSCMHFTLLTEAKDPPTPIQETPGIGPGTGPTSEYPRPMGDGGCCGAQMCCPQQPPPTTKVCEDGRRVPVTATCDQICPDGTRLPERASCPVYNLPQLTTCQGGVVQGNNCVCPADSSPQGTAPNFTCVPQQQPITCQGGVVQGGSCACPAGSYAQGTAPNFVCVRPPQPITCQGGVVQGGNCACPAGFHPLGTAPHFVCVRPPQPTTCVGGSVQGNDCVCAPRTYRVGTAPNFTCAPLRAPITCHGGIVRGHNCACPPGSNRNGAFPNYSCVRQQHPIVCQGGSVQGNNCVCPPRTYRIGTAPNFTCAPLRPVITCQGGTVRGNTCVCPAGMRLQGAAPSFTCIRPAPTGPIVR